MDACRERGCGVPEALLRHLQRDASEREVTGVRVPQVMKANRREPGLPGDAPEIALGDVVAAERLAVRLAETRSGSRA